MRRKAERKRIKRPELDDRENLVAAPASARGNLEELAQLPGADAPSKGSVELSPPVRPPACKPQPPLAPVRPPSLDATPHPPFVHVEPVTPLPKRARKSSPNAVISAVIPAGLTCMDAEAADVLIGAYCKAQGWPRYRPPRKSERVRGPAPVTPVKLGEGVNRATWDQQASLLHVAFELIRREQWWPKPP